MKTAHLRLERYVKPHLGTFLMISAGVGMIGFVMGLGTLSMLLLMLMGLVIMSYYLLYFALKITNGLFESSEGSK